MIEVPMKPAAKPPTILAKRNCHQVFATISMMIASKIKKVKVHRLKRRPKRSAEKGEIT